MRKHEKRQCAELIKTLEEYCEFLYNLNEAAYGSGEINPKQTEKRFQKLINASPSGDCGEKVYHHLKALV